MAHLHSMRDSDSHYVVDPITRVITSGTPVKSTLIQYDHNSEILTFEMPRYVEGHDMLRCTSVTVHFTNTSDANRLSNQGVYEVQDFASAEDDADTIVWSWTISGYATQYVGPLSFAIRFACTSGETLEYAWSTAPFTGIKISSGIYNSDTVVNDYVDILEQWQNKIGVSIDSVKQTETSSEENGANIITFMLSNGERDSVVIRNGKTPVRGVDYWTEADKQEIIDSILDVIPVAEEASF